MAFDRSCPEGPLVLPAPALVLPQWPRRWLFSSPKYAPPNGSRALIAPATLELFISAYNMQKEHYKMKPDQHFPPPIPAVLVVLSSLESAINSKGTFTLVVSAALELVISESAAAAADSLALAVLSSSEAAINTLELVISESAAAAADSLALAVLTSSEAAISIKGSFTLLHVFFVDERNVPHDSVDSSYKALNDALLSQVNIPSAQVHAIGKNLPVAEAAKQYCERLKALAACVLPINEKGFPVFDMVILGIGEDAHIASLFPNWPTLSIADEWIVPIEGSPKPPPERITFTLPLINNAKDIVFFVMGAGKADVVKQVLEVPAPGGALPAQMVRAMDGRLRWMLEAGSAGGLTLGNWEKC
eukprot:gene29010-32201_t